MTKIRVIICDDNANERKHFVSLCKEIGRNNNMIIGVREYENGKQLLFDMEEPRFYANVDIVLLDINMPEINGIEAAKRIRMFGYEGVIIFITGSENHWKCAFNVGAFNYIIKEENLDEEFMDIFLRAAKISDAKRAKKLLLTATGESRQIDIKDIRYFEVVNHIVTVYYGKNDSFEFISTLARLEETLYGQGFARVHKSYIVALFYIDKIAGNEIIMPDGTHIPIGRKYMNDFKKALLERTLAEH